MNRKEEYKRLKENTIDDILTCIKTFSVTDTLVLKEMTNGIYAVRLDRVAIYKHENSEMDLSNMSAEMLIDILEEVKFGPIPSEFNDLQLGFEYLEDTINRVYHLSEEMHREEYGEYDVGTYFISLREDNHRKTFMYTKSENKKRNYFVCIFDTKELDWYLKKKS